MKAIRLTRTGRAVENCEAEMPRPAAGEVVLRVEAAGICHSDVHYRAGTSPTGPLPLTLGHEVAGVVEHVGEDVSNFANGDRVCVHYMATCGACSFCQSGDEQFCPDGQMVGKHRDGGWADFIRVPARSVLPVPDDVAIESAAVMMCSSATSLHALNKARLQVGETVAVFGVGGLGLSAVQLAPLMGSAAVYAVDINPAKLAMAESLGAIPIDACAGDPAARIRAETGGRGVDVALELIGLPETTQQAVESLAIQGRAALAGIGDQPFELRAYGQLINRETEVIGVSDHLESELRQLLAWADAGQIEFDRVITGTVPLDAAAVNHVLDDLESFGDAGRVVIRP
ncbi:MAG: zinc-binding dehydrogenase [Phycisphaerae bacterium]|nr:zinc-binding dehydrogenase [Phycisphaerae bacterium]